MNRYELTMLMLTTILFSYELFSLSMLGICRILWFIELGFYHAWLQFVGKSIIFIVFITYLAYVTGKGLDLREYRLFKSLEKFPISIILVGFFLFIYFYVRHGFGDTYLLPDVIVLGLPLVEYGMVRDRISLINRFFILLGVLASCGDLYELTLVYYNAGIVEHYPLLAMGIVLFGLLIMLNFADSIKYRPLFIIGLVLLTCSNILLPVVQIYKIITFSGIVSYIFAFICRLSPYLLYISFSWRPFTRFYTYFIELLDRVALSSRSSTTSPPSTCPRFSSTCPRDRSSTSSTG